MTFSMRLGGGCYRTVGYLAVEMLPVGGWPPARARTVSVTDIFRLLLRAGCSHIYITALLSPHNYTVLYSTMHNVLILAALHSTLLLPLLSRIIYQRKYF